MNHINFKKHCHFKYFLHNFSIINCNQLKIVHKLLNILFDDSFIRNKSK